MVDITNIYQLMIDELIERKCAYAYRFATYYICSVGCHLLNLYNKKEKILQRGSVVVDLRLHIILVAPPGFCIAADTLISTEYGYRPAKDVQVGDRVYSGKGRLVMVTSKVLSYRDGVKITTSHPKLSLVCSKEHLVKARRQKVKTKWGKEEWIPAGELALTDKVVLELQQEAKIAKIEAVGKQEMVDFEVSEDESLIANQIVVHNSKTYFLEQFLRGDAALLAQSKIPITMEGTMTGAGFVGTTKFEDGEQVRVPGLAEECSTAIAGIEEFSAVTNMFKVHYAGELDVSLLGALDSGWCYKRLAAGPIKYQTYITLQTGCQPARYDLSSGMARRFLFLEFIPNRSDFYTLRSAQRKARGIGANITRTQLIWKELEKLATYGTKEIKEIWLDDKFYDLMDKWEVWHYDEILFERLLTGYNLMKGNVQKGILKVDVDKEAERLLFGEVGFRKAIKRGSIFNQVFTILHDANGILSELDLKEKLIDYGLDYTQSSEVINQMFHLRLIRRLGEKVALLVLPKKEKEVKESERKK